MRASTAPIPMAATTKMAVYIKLFFFELLAGVGSAAERGEMRAGGSLRCAGAEDAAAAAARGDVGRARF